MDLSLAVSDKWLVSSQIADLSDLVLPETAELIWCDAEKMSGNCEGGDVAVGEMNGERDLAAYERERSEVRKSGTSFSTTAIHKLLDYRRLHFKQLKFRRSISARNSQYQFQIVPFYKVTFLH